MLLLIALIGMNKGQVLNQLTLGVDFKYLILSELIRGALLQLHTVVCIAVIHLINASLNGFLVMSIDHSVVVPVAVIDFTIHFEALETVDLTFLIQRFAREQVTSLEVPLAKITFLIEGVEEITNLTIAEIVAALSHAHKLNGISVD